MREDTNISSLDNYREEQQEIHDDRVVKDAWEEISLAVSQIEQIIDETPGKLELDEFRDAFFASISDDLWRII